MMQLDPSSSLTILIPLHRAMPWVDIISANLQLCPRNCQVIISDGTGEDDALKHLHEKHQHDKRITFLKNRKLPGWRAHLNDLIGRVNSELFSILPQDDSITVNYYDKLSSQFIVEKNLAIACSSVVAHNYKNSPVPVDFERMPEREGDIEPWRAIINLERYWNLGIAFRGVIRRSFAKTIAPTTGDAQADIFWLFGIGLHGYIIEVPDLIYHKRYHDQSAHVGWESFTTKEHRMFLKREIIRHLYRQPLKMFKAIRYLNSFDLK